MGLIEGRSALGTLKGQLLSHDGGLQSAMAALCLYSLTHAKPHIACFSHSTPLTKTWLQGIGSESFAEFDALVAQGPELDRPADRVRFCSSQKPKTHSCGN